MSTAESATSRAGSDHDLAALRAAIAQRLRLPASTYRLQLNHQFTFAAATEVLPYLAELGISDCYCSPYLKARPGSMHGYDICDHNTLNPEVGSPEDYEAFVQALAAQAMGQVLDFVPNHMGVDPAMNPWWHDVLENGQASRYARYFDIDWHPVKSELDDKLLLPILGDQYGIVLERGDLKLGFVNGTLVVNYGPIRLPVDPRQCAVVYRLGLEELQKEMTGADPHLQEFLSILTQLDHLPTTTERSPERIAERHREEHVAAERLARLAEAAPRIRAHIEHNIAVFNGEPGKPETFDRLHELLEALPYRLAYWKTALHEINYRRFFDINDLAGLRMEDPEVFASTHALVARLITDGKLTGLRLDHIDGLFDPQGYLQRLQEMVVQARAAALGENRGTPEEWRQTLHEWRESERSRDAWGVVARPLYVLAEKILSGGEALPTIWPLFGTSGYDSLNDINRLFVDYQHAKGMKRAYERFTGEEKPFPDVVYECKKLISETAMASELNVLAFALNRISEANRRARDFTLNSLRDALTEVVACFPVYRTYINAAGASETDRQMIDIALSRARARNPAMEPTVFEFLRSVLMPQPEEGISETEYKARLAFTMKFQQYTGPVQAKGVEDTAFYRYNVLVSLNEVGGDPQRFGAPPAQFHAANRKRQEQWPYSMLASATHDTKRGEDVRARLNVLSEMPETWRRQLFRWSRLNAPHRTLVQGEPAPDRNDEYLLYQTLVGAWPAEMPDRASPEFVERVRNYMHKALKESKVHTSWISPNEAYDLAVAQFVDKTLTGPRAARFLGEFVPFARRVGHLGVFNSLAQTVVKLTSPGVPDIYQGTELWDLSLVDPDNRRAVDFEHRRRILTDLRQRIDQAGDSLNGLARELIDAPADGRVKMYVLHRTLPYRRAHRRLFCEGDYQPLDLAAEHRDNACAFARSLDRQRIIVIVPRLLARLIDHPQRLPVGDLWRDTYVSLPNDDRGARYRDLYTGETLNVQEQGDSAFLTLAAVFKDFPVALLERLRE
jgi:(1->4)-alpha-D-glucan 1-alpha-D-glucosylmutase